MLTSSKCERVTKGRSSVANFTLIKSGVRPSVDLFFLRLIRRPLRGSPSSNRSWFTSSSWPRLSALALGTGGGVSSGARTCFSFPRSSLPTPVVCSLAGAAGLRPLPRGTSQRFRPPGERLPSPCARLRRTSRRGLGSLVWGGEDEGLEAEMLSCPVPPDGESDRVVVPLSNGGM